MLACYCWPQSVVTGESFAVHVSAARGPVQLDILHLGQDGQRVAGAARLAAIEQAVPADCAAFGCGWSETATFEVKPDWPSALYLVRVTDADGNTADAFVVVRRQEPADALLVLSTSTWAAYNHWGGPSFYTGGHRSSLQRPLPSGFLQRDNPQQQRLARYMTWDRQEAAHFRDSGYSQWSMAAGWANWETLFVRWAQAKGLRLGFAVSSDLETVPGLLDGWPAYLSVGHDEYWSGAMRDAVEDYIDAGGNAAFFSGNTAFWQARFEADHTALVCHKFALQQDPRWNDGRFGEVTTMWSDPLAERPENNMTGVSFTRGGYARMPNSPTGTGGYTVWRPEHWAFEGLSLRTGDVIGSAPVVVGYECDGCELALRDGRPIATGRDGTPEHLEVLGTGPAHLWENAELVDGLDDGYVGELNWVAERIGGADDATTRARFEYGNAVLGAFSRGRGQVFTTGCTDWAYGLADPAIDTITGNVLQRFVGRVL